VIFVVWNIVDSYIAIALRDEKLGDHIRYLFQVPLAVRRRGIGGRKPSLQCVRVRLMICPFWGPARSRGEILVRGEPVQAIFEISIEGTWPTMVGSRTLR
jgi:hypothetical protein